MSIRQADMTDLDAMVDVCLAASPMDPKWDYRLRYREQYPEDTLRFTRKRLNMFLENEAGNWQVMVAELPSLEDSSISKVAAFAAWQLRPADQVTIPLRADKTHGPLTTSEVGSSEQRRDADPKRMKVFEESLENARTHFFKQVYGENRMQLRLLVTHPDYQRRCAGGKLVRWGLKKAKENNLAVTLFAGPMGEPLYRKLGFRDLSVIKIQVDGESESVSVVVMVWVPTCDEG